MQNERKAAEDLVNKYADALNRADVTTISSFYTGESCFMPDGFKTLTLDEIVYSGDNYLSENKFHIQYTVTDVDLQGAFAFITATAQTIAFTPSGKEEVRNSRDFFVLRKQEQEWKIFRYIFNNVSNSLNP